MSRKSALIYVAIVLAAVMATPALRDYAQARRAQPGVGGEFMLALVAALGCSLWEQGKEFFKMWKEGKKE